MEQVIKTNNLTKKFGSFTAVDNISFYVNKGEIFLVQTEQEKQQLCVCFAACQSLHQALEVWQVVIYQRNMKKLKKI